MTTLIVLSAWYLPRAGIRAADGGNLSIVSAGPIGEIATLEEANEIRIVFSEPMVVVGRIPQPVTAPFVTIAPAISGGTFRWSGTTILIYTPDPKRPLPFATRYTVTVGGGTAAVSGRRLTAPFTFSFTTPTVKLRAADEFRKNGRYDSPMLVALRFHQPVRPEVMAAHTRMQFEPHRWETPTLSEAASARLIPTAPRRSSGSTRKSRPRRRLPRRPRRDLRRGVRVGSQAVSAVT